MMISMMILTCDDDVNDFDDDEDDDDDDNVDFVDVDVND